MAEKKEAVKQDDARDLWSQRANSIPITRYAKETADSEKLLVFSETGGGKTNFYLQMLTYLKDVKKIPKDELKMFIIFPDRPQGLVKLYGLIPAEYRDCIEIFPVGTYEETIKATATAVEALEEHHKKTGRYGWIVFELIENYWTFSQDYFCREAYGTSMAEFFAQMQSISSKDRAEKRTAYEAFAGPFGGPWPIIKFFHNFNWIDRVKRMPFNIIFTSELKEEDNKDSIFSDLGYRPAGEKHTQHKVDTIIYLTHKGNKFFMKPFKLTGFRRLYSQLEVTDKNPYEVHKEALEKLAKMGHMVSKMDDIEKQANIKPPKPKEEKKIIKTVSKTEDGEKEGAISQKELVTPEKKEEEATDEDVWTV